MYIYSITKNEQKELNDLLNDVTLKYSSAEDEEFIKRAYLYAAELPENIKFELFRLRNVQNHDGILMIRGFASQTKLRKTPKSWKLEDSYNADMDFDYLAIILSSILGDPFGFETQQKGKLIHDIVPIKGQENIQAGSSSLTKLNFHTEDAFHPYKADYICLNCLKNPVNVGTLAVGVHELTIPSEVKSVLLQKRFYTKTDNTHDVELQTPTLHSILFGNEENPYICIDYDFTCAVEGDVEAQSSLDYLIREIELKLHEIIIEPGDFYFIDNYKWLHGRKSFVAKFDGNDRWLRRFNISKDIRESVRYKSDINSRMLSAEPVY